MLTNAAAILVTYSLLPSAFVQDEFGFLENSRRAQKERFYHLNYVRYDNFGNLFLQMQATAAKAKKELEVTLDARGLLTDAFVADFDDSSR